MVEKDYIVPGIIIEQQAKFDLNELYKFLKDWFTSRNYDLFEKKYEELQGANINTKWDAEKKIDDYTKFIISVKIKCTNIHDVKTAKRALKEGNINIKFESVIERDYEDRWEVRPSHKLIRGIFDKYVKKGQAEEYEEKLKKETYHIYEDTKAFLNMPRF